MCKCDCGKYFKAITAELNNGSVKSCGCLDKIIAKQNGRKVVHDLTGQRFGLLTVIEESKERLGGNIK